MGHNYTTRTDSAAEAAKCREAGAVAAASLSRRLKSIPCGKIHPRRRLADSRLVLNGKLTEVLRLPEVPLQMRGLTPPAQWRKSFEI